MGISGKSAGIDRISPTGSNASRYNNLFAFDYPPMAGWEPCLASCSAAAFSIE